ncbi:hypothetical protein HETIRDRAFT_429262 [Heterobasidion irregulare TC 32-1]|uniref:Helicase C-terminal domain-containing protein n=1 Tax=Heterobasidion irregulare (strain TC 32-1) TaxID=747525 RepID=W4JYM4_HETIT|nr:uncharacterized protein HETIRDRAFT_429262 [Heterobasidion irregulare TC 32-1]ETW78200.1 hypothetical protein HETIRDRAFT_429262 [Heterobasidion irregulare TC 32-1]
MADSQHPTIPLLSEIRKKATKFFGRRPCIWQLKAIQAIIRQDQDVVCIAGTGLGKTMTFWMPLLFRKDGIQIVVTPLNILGQHNVDQLAAIGDIAEGKYRAIMVIPEVLMKDGGGFEKLWKNEAFVSHVILQIDRSKAAIIWRSNDRPNVHLMVRKIQHTLNSVAAAKSLRKQLPKSHGNKIKWFNANMSSQFCKEEVAAFRDGDTWGLCCTDSFGTGIDIPHIALIVQWCAKCRLCSLWQRFGRGARQMDLKAMAILFVEAKYFDEDKLKAANAKALRAEKKGKRKAVESAGQAISEKHKVLFQMPSQSANLVARVYFANDKLDAFEHLQFTNRAAARTRRPQFPALPRARHLDTKYIVTPIDMELHDVLHQYWKERMAAKYGPALLKDLGPGLIMSNQIIQRIIDAVHAGRIALLGDLKHEVKWSRADKLGKDVLPIAQQHQLLSQRRSTDMQALSPGHFRLPPELSTYTPAGPAAFRDIQSQCWRLFSAKQELPIVVVKGWGPSDTE